MTNGGSYYSFISKVLQVCGQTYFSVSENVTVLISSKMTSWKKSNGCLSSLFVVYIINIFIMYSMLQLSVHWLLEVFKSNFDARRFLRSHIAPNFGNREGIPVERKTECQRIPLRNLLWTTLVYKENIVTLCVCNFQFRTGFFPS